MSPRHRRSIFVTAPLVFSEVSIFCPWTPLGSSVPRPPGLSPFSKFLATPLQFGNGNATRELDGTGVKPHPGDIYCVIGVASVSDVPSRGVQCTVSGSSERRQWTTRLASHYSRLSFCQQIHPTPRNDLFLVNTASLPPLYVYLSIFKCHTLRFCWNCARLNGETGHVIDIKAENGWRPQMAMPC